MSTLTRKRSFLPKAVFPLFVILYGCVRDTTLNPGLERKVVVEFVLTDESVQNLYLSLTREPGELAAPIIREAEIKLINLSEELESEHRFVKSADNLWTLDYSGIPGNQYRLEVKVDGYDPVWAEQKMPEKVELLRAAIGDILPLPSYMSYGYFYHIDNIPDFLVIRGMKRDNKTGEFLPVKELCTDYPGVIDLNSTGRLYDGNPKWRMEKALGSDIFIYYDSPIYGMDGVWTYMFPNLIGKPLQKDFLFIAHVDDEYAGLDDLYDFPTEKELFCGKAFCISGSFDMNQPYYDSDFHLIGYEEYLLASSLSPDYGLFLKEAWQLKKVHEGGDLSSIYLRDNIHSNIQGGLGLFGAKVSSKTEFYGYYREK